jgi:amino acid transporter/soluble cytochrome b562
MSPAIKRLKLGAKRSRGTLGTFPGVFTPSILTILGIILFLRLGYVVGSAGLGRALLIICLANIISVLTSMSLAAMATNLRVKVGGHYYLISRTLGVEFGGAIGIVLFLAMSVSIAFYCIGLGEAVASMIPNAGGALPQIIAVLVILFLSIFAWLGADWATRLQYVVMSILAASLISFYIGGFVHFDGGLLARNWAAPAVGPSFWMLFAIFFPAVTGFTQGVSMSGDLKEPSKSIALGTFAAVGISIVIYLTVAVVFAAAMPKEALSGDYHAMWHVAVIGWLISAGVIAGTFSSAMASLLGAPRILQSLAQDRIFPLLFPFAKGAGAVQNPRRGVLLSAGIAMATVGLGNLNVIAPVVSMFFLISYGLLNYATFYEARGASPSFRPTFRWFQHRLCLLGALGCLGVMLAIDMVSSAIAVAVLFGIHQYLQRTAGPARWADSKRSYHFQLMREHLFAIPGEPEHPRDWRPQLLVFSDDPPRRRNLLRFASWIEGDSGLTTVVKIVVGQGKKVYQQRAEAEAEFREEIEELGLKAFAKVVVAPDFGIGAQTLFQSFGIGPVHANTILVNGPEQLMETKDPQGRRQYGRYLSEAFSLGSNVVIFNAQEEEWSHVEGLPAQDRRIDVWWWDDATSHLMLLFAYLMTRKDDWSEARIRVLAPTASRGAKRNLENLSRTLEDVRISAEPEVIVEPNLDTIAKQSADAVFAFLPLHVRGNRLVSPLGVSFDEILSRIPLGALVIAAEDIDLEAEPEEGRQGEIAAALDAVADADRRAREKEKEATKTAEFAEEKLGEMKKASETDRSKGELTKMKTAFREAEKVAKKAAREAEKARAEADEETKAADELIKQPEGANKPVLTEQIPKKKIKKKGGAKKGKSEVKK